MDSYQLFAQNPSNFYFLIAISIVISLIISTAPALIIRFAILKRPMERSSATWLSIAICLITFVLLFVIAAKLGSAKPGNGLWLIVWFFIDRAILQHGKQERAIRPANEQK